MNDLISDLDIATKTQGIFILSMHAFKVCKFFFDHFFKKLENETLQIISIQIVKPDVGDSKKIGDFLAFNVIMLAQFQQTFSKISKEIIIESFNCTTSQQQHHLMRLFKEFGDKLEKTMILQTWRNHNNIFVETRMKLMEICATSNLNELKENELKILRKICLHILWNILKYPKHIKYRQINKQALCNYLFQKCHTLGADFEKVLIDMGKRLQCIGFKKENDNNWYHQCDHIEIHLWESYKYLINKQIMCVYFIVVNKTND
ncbi:hypothetical protein RFI_20503 [Reticulomyxa filosa]|uniref:Uncharacterized protein n=1 Tax=Reticulomyxa filosa TaxID=46433 RepID=X6MT64_RETFI|nr:hypothetical protein RFI_20503 [Reticulomyxa filosa]|eukprot:ETO16836.1 hypothetical protein RFI_20503 [Reticulomyxa filosa]